MTDIRKPGDAVGQVQQARDVLAKWREETTAGPWSREEMPETGENRVVREFEFFGDQIEEVAPGGLHAADARLIVGTAGNPALLDAIDGLLHAAQRYPGLQWIDGDAYLFRQHAERLATAIVAADERMTS